MSALGQESQAGGRRLVFGDDGSRGADVAWLWINNHAWPEWTIDVLTGADPLQSPPRWGVEPELVPWTSPWGRTPLGARTAVTTTRRSEADPRLLLDAQGDAALVVVGHSGAGHLRSHWMGSTTEWLLHHPTAPLVIVRSASTARRILCCVDGSVHAARALSALVGCPFAADAAVTLLTVRDNRTDPDDAVAEATELLRTKRIDAAVEVSNGHPTTRIVDHIEEHAPDLVVMGTKGLTGWRRLRLGSTASAVVHQTAGNVMVASASGSTEP